MGEGGAEEFGTVRNNRGIGELFLGKVVVASPSLDATRDTVIDRSLLHLQRKRKHVGKFSRWRIRISR